MIAFSEEDDIALIEVERTDEKDKKIPFLKLSSDLPQERETVWTWGYAGGFLKTFKSEVTTLKWLDSILFWEFDLFQISTQRTTYVPIETDGMSGSPVVNDKGEVVGVYKSFNFLVYNDKPHLIEYVRDNVSSVSRLKELLKSVKVDFPETELQEGTYP